MAIPRNYRTSNPIVRDALADIPRAMGTKAGHVAMPDVPIPAEIVTSVSVVEHSLNLDDLRAPGTLAKEVTFEGSTSTEISVIEHAQKSTLDIRDIEAAGVYGVQMMAERASLHRQDIEDAKEFRIATLATTIANYDAAHSNAGDDLSAVGLRGMYAGWANPIKTAGFAPTDMILSPNAVTAFANNAEMQAWFGSKGEGFIDEAVIKAFFRIPGQVIVADYSRILGNGTAPTSFWPASFVLLVSNSQPSISNRVFGATPVVPYGAAFGKGGVITDVRTADLPGVEGLREVGAFQRYRPMGLNFNLAFFSSAVVGF